MDSPSQDWPVTVQVKLWRLAFTEIHFRNFKDVRSIVLIQGSRMNWKISIHEFGK